MEFSTLNGYKVKDKKAIRYYDTVADMKNDTTLKVGMHVKTKGYYTADDGGQGEYIIINDNSLVDNGGLVHTLDNDLKAKLLINSSINVKQFGAYGDSTHDDTNAINECCSVSNTLNINMVINKGTYLVSDMIEMPVNVTITSENAQINSSQTTGDIISCNREGYVTGTQPKYTMIGNLTINATNQENTLNGLHIGASKKSLFKNILITNTLNSGILVKSTHSGDVDNFNIDLCHCYNTGGLVIESGANDITNGSVTDGSVRNSIFDSPLQKSAITINKNSNKAIFGIKFDRNFLASSNYPVLTINNSLSNVFIYYLEFIENSVEIRNSSNNPLYATITGVSNSVFDLQGTLVNTSGFDINNCRNCTFKRIEYTGYLGLNDKIFDLDSTCYNINFENMIIPMIDYWFNNSLSFNAQLSSKWNSLFVDNGYNNKIVNSLPFTNVIQSIVNFNNILSLAEVTPTTGYSLRYSTATSSNNQLTVILQNSQNSPRIELPIYNCSKSFVGIHIRYKLNGTFDPTGTAKLRLMPFNNFSLQPLPTETNTWYDICAIVPVSSNKTYFGMDGYLNTDLSVTIDKFEIIDEFSLPYINNYSVIEGNQ